MRLKFITATALLSACLLSLLFAAAPVAAEDILLQENRPESYTVQKGDTLWGIAGKFLKQPWRWPDIWRMNRDQIKNPHWIYPGDVISLDKVNGEWQLSINRGDGPSGRNVRISPSVRIDSLQAEAIPSIPPGDLTPYLTQPIITGPDGLPGAARIIAARDNRVVRGEGDSVYAVSIDEKLGTEWVIYRPGKILRSFDSNETLGYEMRYLGTARVERFGEVSRMLITTAREEILLNDLLVPAPRETLVNYVPHAPDLAIDGRIIELYNAGTEAGRGFIVVLDRGARDGLEVGNVLAIYHPSPVIPDPRPYESPDVFSKLSEATKVIIPPTKFLNVPPERSGLLFVFRVFDRVSYAILLNTSEPVVIGDMARKP
jgi:LysM domain